MFGPLGTPIPDGKSAAPQLMSHASLARNFASPARRSSVTEYSFESNALCVKSTSASHPNGVAEPMIPISEKPSKKYSPVIELNVISYDPAGTGILGPPCTPTPIGKSESPQLISHASLALNLTSPKTRSIDIDHRCALSGCCTMSVS